MFIFQLVGQLTGSLIERVAAGSDEQPQHVHAVRVELRRHGDGFL